MKNDDLSKAEISLERLSRTIQNLTEYVGQKYFPSFRLPDSELSENAFSNSFSSFLHRTFSLTKWLSSYTFFFPSSIILFTLSFISLILQPFMLPISYFIFNPSLLLHQDRYIVFTVAIVAILVVIYSTVGGFWKLYETIINNKISFKTKAFITLLIFALLYHWVFNIGISKWIGLLSATDNEIFNQYIIEASNNIWVVLINIIFITAPTIILFSLFISKMIIFDLFFVGRLLQWFFIMQITQSQQRLSEFLKTHLLLFNDDEPQILLEAEKAHISAIKNWVNTRRRTIQNRLVPASLGIAFLGILASTSMGENALSLVSKILEDYFSIPSTSAQTGGFVTWIISFGKFLGIIGIFGLLVGPLSLLLHESVILDFISEACALAEGVQTIQENEIKPIIVEKPNWLLSFISRIFRKK